MKTIELSQGLQSLVDDEDFENLSRHKWCVSKQHSGWAAVRWHKGKMIYMHRQLLGFPAACVDHVNGNTLDNQKSNLRLATQTENKRNSKKPKHGVTSKYKGVRFHKVTKKWTAQISVNNRSRYLGIFPTELEAAAAYNSAARSAFGDFARLNAL